MNFTIIQPNTANIFDALYDNHDLYLNCSDLQIQPKTFVKQTNFVHSPAKRNQSLSVHKNIESANEHLQFLSFLQTEYEKRLNAAKKIQKYWKRYKFRVVYFRLKKLLKRCTEIEPWLALRTVNPREASLLDAPSGAIVRFKLAGGEFPPKIVYKIFSYRPVARVHTLPPEMTNISHKHLDNIIHEGYKKNMYNDWRIYGENRVDNGSINKDKKHMVKRRHSTKITRKSNVMAWMKSQYGV